MLRKNDALWFEFVIGPPAKTVVVMVIAATRANANFVKIFIFILFSYARHFILFLRAEGSFTHPET